MTSKIFLLPPQTSPLEVKRVLQAHFAAAGGTLRRHPLNLLDSFDWRLFRQGQLLLATSGLWRLVDQHTGKVIASAAGDMPDLPLFWWQLPDSELRKILREALDVRALMCRLPLRRAVMALQMSNEAQAIVAGVDVDILRIADAPARAAALLGTCTPASVRGHAPARRAVEKVLTAMGAMPAREHPLVTALHRAGQQPGHYSTKIELRLEPELTVPAAARIILKHLVGIMRCNEEGIRQDIDTEFLHDFRVAVRRSRSLFTLLKQELEPTALAELKTGLRELGQATNALRDLDVYLLRQERYRKLLPAALRPAIAAWFEALRRQRRRAVKKMGSFLASDRHGRIMAAVERFAGVQGEAAGPQARSILDVARREIGRRFQKTIHIGRRIDVATADARLHRLRIQCKQLRYALEFFHSLFPPEPVAEIIRQAKVLQDYLGAYNDLAVQQQFLFDHLKQLPAQKTPRQEALAAAVGALMGSLFLEKQQRRAAFADVFVRFDTADNHALFQNLCTPPSKAIEPQ
ncbi:MAG: CHAD domain-containing protein [Desulfatitalea sp.]